jgi:hypothetical protein
VSDERTRAQLLLIGSITIAVVVLTSVVLLNSVHSSPSITTESDSRTLESVESVNTEVEQNVQELFDATGSGGKILPHTNASEFDDILEEYQESYTDVATVDGAIDISVERTDGTTGAVAYNRSIENVEADGNETTLLNSTTPADVPIPSLSLNAEGIDEGAAVRVKFGPNPLNRIEIENKTAPGGISLPGPPATTPACVKTIQQVGNVSINLEAGVGTLQVGNTTCALGPGDLDIPEGTPISVQVADTGGIDPEVDELSYAISAVAPDNACGIPAADKAFENCVDTSRAGAGNVVLVNAELAVETRYPSLGYNSTSRLFGGET